MPWVVAQTPEPKPRTPQQSKKTEAIASEESKSALVLPETPKQVFNRYYHLFSQGELTELVMEAALDMGLVIGQPPEAQTQGPKIRGLQIVQDDWERSNYYVELRRWEQ